MTRKPNLVLVLLLAMSLALTACSSGGDDPPQAAGDADKGKDLYAQNCAACHGPNGEGIQNLGKPFQGSDFLKSSDDDGLLGFVKTGRPSGDPQHQGADMPPKGGNPDLSDDDLRNIIAFLRTLQ